MATPTLLNQGKAGYRSEKEIYDILKQAGFKGKDLEYAFKIAYAESMHQPLITNETTYVADGQGNNVPVPGRISYGLFQITQPLLEDYYNDYIGEEKNVHEKSIEDWDESELREFLDPLNIAKFTKYVVDKLGWTPWATDTMLENLKGDADTPSEEFRHKGPEEAYAHSQKIDMGDGIDYPAAYRNLIEKMEVATTKFAQIEGTEYNLGLQNFPLSDKGYTFKTKYPNQAEFDTYMTESTKTEIPTALKPPMFPSQQEYESTVRKRTSDVLATGTDQVETDRFKPKFMDPKPQGGAIGARQNMVQ